MAGRTSPQGPKLKYLSDQSFEDEAALLLAEFGNAQGQITSPPIPIDDIVEGHLKLTLEFIDTRAKFGVDDVHGAIWFNDRLVGIDLRLDPYNNPAKLGRYRFTLAHEAGHWRLHRNLYLRKANQSSLLPDATPRPDFVCRSSDKPPIEYQADRFASCLLMPKEMVKRSWHDWRGDMEPINLTDLRAEADDGMSDERLLEDAIRPFAGLFEVSPEAMRIRCEGMGLLIRKTEASLF